MQSSPDYRDGGLAVISYYFSRTTLAGADGDRRDVNRRTDYARREDTSHEGRCEEDRTDSSPTASIICVGIRRCFSFYPNVKAGPERAITLTLVSSGERV